MKKNISIILNVSLIVWIFSTNLSVIAIFQFNNNRNVAESGSNLDIITTKGDFLPISSTDIDFNNIEQAKELTGISKLVESESLSGNNITIAFLDTGIKYTHEVFDSFGDADFSKKVIGYYNAVNDSWTQFILPEDVDGHGSHVASICSGNSTRYKGIAPDSHIVMIRIFYFNGTDIVTNNSIIIRALDWVIQNKEKYNIQILSMSFGDSIRSDGKDIVSSKVDELVSHGILPIISAGNFGYLGVPTIGIPASSKYAITVGGTDLEGYFYEKSSMGPTLDGRIKPDVLAPGENILGADIATNIDYKYITGTSQSAPIVSGLSALLLEFDDSLEPMKIKQLISLSTRKIFGSISYRDNKRGWGLVKANPIIDLINKEINISNSIVVDLNGSMKEDGIWARKLQVDDGVPTIFKMNTTDAELLIFKEKPNDFGEPVIVSWSGNNLGNKIAFYSLENENYYIICKIKPGIEFLSVKIDSIAINFSNSMIWVMFLVIIPYFAIISYTFKRVLQ